MSSVSQVFDVLREEIDQNYKMEKSAGITAALWWVPPVSCSLYLILVWSGKKWMDKRPPFGLRLPLLVWNVFLAVFSTIGAVIEVPSLVNNVRENGLDYTLCNSETEKVPLLALFALLFVFSKVIEFGDTLFVVLRKTPLNFLHWYHHVTVCLFSWHSLAIRSAPAHWYCAMNYAVHSIMYSYYIVKSSGIRMPSVVAQSVTLLQLIQFVAGFGVVLRSFWLYSSGVPCNTNSLNCIIGIVIYSSYLVLFGDFFYHRYIKVEKKKKL